jgi:hypothetical protein
MTVRGEALRADHHLRMLKLVCFVYLVHLVYLV